MAVEGSFGTVHYATSSISARAPVNSFWMIGSLRVPLPNTQISWCTADNGRAKGSYIAIDVISNLDSARDGSKE